MKIEKSVIAALLVLVVLTAGVIAATNDPERVGTTDVTVCCQKTVSGLLCQDVLENECATDSEFALPTSCESTGPCDPGYCYDSEEGTCLDNVPQMVCNNEGGTWSSDKPAACNLGCCILGDQAAFVTLVRCKRLSSFYGLDTNFDPDSESAAQCILQAKADEKGACVYEEDFEKTCKFTTRSACDPDSLNGHSQTDTSGGNLFENVGGTTDGTGEDTAGDSTSGDTTSGEDVQPSPTGCQNIAEGIEFCPGMLCSAEELNTNCGPTKDTMCVEGKEEVYFKDTCGNPANIYDASKVNDDTYWTYIIDKAESCMPGSANIDSQTCGNCYYLLGSYCGASGIGAAKPTYGTNVCIDLNCPASDMTGGVKRLHGESWCGFDTDRDFSFQENAQSYEDNVAKSFKEALASLHSGGGIGADFKGSDVPVGSKFYRYICSHGEVLVEPCADFRQEECIENNVAGYSEAACRVNRWQDCTAIYTKLDCENTDQRDCVWLEGIQYVLMGGLSNGTVLDKSSLAAAKEEIKKFKSGDRELGGCVPKTPPGLKFWGTEEGDNAEAASICSQANAMCPVTYEKGLVGGGWECVENCECLDEGLQLQRAQLCMAMGDCGPKVNYIGSSGRTAGYKIFEEDLKKKK
ncbi:MAG: hypothetical protein KKD18_05860 [Nanoarchaeota archaeon]|nr:hypothetical protein [Nanoarchaeota archaeon]MBU0977916.1 hypothetical protein [Nanoarchaeota archaeon]